MDSRMVSGIKCKGEYIIEEDRPEIEFRTCAVERGSSKTGSPAGRILAGQGLKS